MGPRWSQKGQGTSVPPRLAASRALLSLAQPRVAQPSSQLKHFRALHPDGHPPAPYLGGVPMSVPALISLQTLSLCSYTGSTSHPCPLALQAGQAQWHKKRIWGSKWVLSIFFPFFFSREVLWVQRDLHPRAQGTAGLRCHIVTSVSLLICSG